MTWLRKYWAWALAALAGIGFAIVRLLQRRAVEREISRRVDVEVRAKEADAINGDADALRSRREALEAQIEKLDARDSSETRDVDARALADEWMRLRNGR